MEQYINKSAVVAEIVKRIKAIPRGETDKRLKVVYGNEAFVLNDLLSSINTLETKEMGLDEETLHSELRKIYASIYDSKDIESAKHFFELGLKASNPTTAADRGTAEEIRKLMAEGFENNIKALRQKIWDYMAEHPTKDRGVIISPETHDLIIEDVGYGDLENACYMYANKFHFEMKEED